MHEAILIKKINLVLFLINNIYQQVEKVNKKLKKEKTFSENMNIENAVSMSMLQGI